MSDARWVTAGALLLGALATVAALSPEVDRAVTAAATLLLGVGAVAGLAGYRTHVRRVRRDVERRGDGPATDEPSTGVTTVHPVDPDTPRALHTPAGPTRPARTAAASMSPTRRPASAG